ncbi:hypothetical protein BDW62DRAFT_193965 [Aspergillus aurantiobrunneus]
MNAHHTTAPRTIALPMSVPHTKNTGAPLTTGPPTRKAAPTTVLHMKSTAPTTPALARLITPLLPSQWAGFKNGSLVPAAPSSSKPPPAAPSGPSRLTFPTAAARRPAASVMTTMPPPRCPRQGTRPRRAIHLSTPRRSTGASIRRRRRRRRAVTLGSCLLLVRRVWRLEGLEVRFWGMNLLRMTRRKSRILSTLARTRRTIQLTSDKGHRSWSVVLLVSEGLA